TPLLPVLFETQISEPGLCPSPSGISLHDSTANVSFAIISVNYLGDGRCRISVRNVISDGQYVAAKLSEGAFHDIAGNPSFASTSTDNIIVVDNVGPSVTIEQADGQSDPA